MNFTPICLIAVLSLAFLGGCKDKPKEVSPLARKEAANLASEAEFAVQLRDFGRAEGLFVRATELDGENGDYWLALGVTRKRQGNTSAARKAYEGALAASERAYNQDEKNVEARLRQVHVLALLGRVDDARKVLDAAAKKHPDDREVKAFVNAKALDRMLADPAFKEIAL